MAHRKSERNPRKSLPIINESLKNDLASLVSIQWDSEVPPSEIVLEDEEKKSDRKSVTFHRRSSSAKGKPPINPSPFTLKLKELLNCREQQDVIIDEIDYTPRCLAPTRYGEDKYSWDQLQARYPGDDDDRSPDVCSILSLDWIDEPSGNDVKSSAEQSTRMEEPAQAPDKVEAFDLDQEPDFSGVIDRRSPSLEKDAKTYHVKILLTETDNIILYEAASHTVAQDSEEAASVQEQNTYYENKKKNRRTAMAAAEAQTPEMLLKSRGVNTERIKREEVASFVSNYDMYDTYNDLERHTKEIDLAEASSKIEITTYSREGMENIDDLLNKSENFHLSSMILERLLAGNVYREKQKRFRNMYMPDPLDVNAKYLYRLETLWTYRTVETAGKAVASASWCPANGDIVAIAYGIYRFTKFDDRSTGYVCVWSIKNPVNPERRYQFSVPVTAVAFSKKTPQLLAVGLYDGSVQIWDIMDNSQRPVGVSERKSSPGFEPIWDIEWIESDDDKDEILTASQDGTIMKYTLNIGHYLIGYTQLRLDRVECETEGIEVEKKKDGIEADRHPQALSLKIHPVRKDIYFIGTDEGCVHRCSINYSYQHSGVSRMHSGGVFGIEYSPWSPKVYLTCGGDWCIRIWIEDINEPILTLSTGFGPIQAAHWSPVNSTIIVSVTQDSVQLWDLKRRMLKPASFTTFGDSTTALTVVKFTNCGRSVLVGDSEGRTYICALEDMPFPPHFQYKELQSALYKNLICKPELLKLVKRCGYLGY
ncbi:WD repeat-containing protein 78 [Aedes aegypti]|uniref:Dynein axonemal intermediate chain 4 n=1 Tax=Aedes aegypti TaxID=7159 RepID=A0A6I8TD74_AEDAE|nr:WD repeat-containing protein 78 [Aedes aegypti]